MMRSRLVLPAVLSLCACGPSVLPPDAPVGERLEEIVGGTPDTTDNNVFMLYLIANNGQGSLCTATLIDRRTLLTAAHCVDPAILNATSLTIVASNANTESEIVRGVNTWNVVETRKHPQWNPNIGLSNDIAMALLERAPTGITPKPWNTTSISTYGGRPVRAIGYGTIGNNMGSGTRRQVDLSMRQLTSSLLYIGNMSNKGICHGDSGGPTFHTFADGVERVVGVHSFTNTEACTDGADTRVDAYASFVRQWLTEKEAPTCAEDGRCVQGCPQVDVDCVCGADGVCSTQCPDLSKDPDCPPDCGANGICSTAACPVSDPDCVPQGGACTAATQCVGRRCVVDPQHGTPYCSLPCTSTAQCGNGYECDTANGLCRHVQLPERNLGEACTPGQTYCGPVGLCTGKSQSNTVCAIGCVQTSDCPGKQTCEISWDSKKFCQEPPKPPVVLTLAKVDAPAITGCSTGVGLLPVLGLLVLSLRRRRI